MDRMKLLPGQKISRDGLDDIVAKIYGTNCYDYVTYELLGAEEPFKLVLNCKRGPIHQLGIGVRADTEEIVSVLLNVGINVHRLHGHSFDLTGKISANPYFQLKWSYDVPDIPTLNASASFRWTNMGMLNFGSNNLSLSYFNARQEAYVSNIRWKFFDIRGGLRNDIFNITNIKSSEIIDEYDLTNLSNDFLSLFAEGRTDTFDDGYFPTRGLNAGVSYAWTFAGVPDMVHNFHALQADAKVVVSAGDVFAFIPSVNCRFLMGKDIPLAYFNAVGGSLPGRFVDQQMPFIGVTNLVAMENIMTLFRTDFRFTLAKNHYLTGIVNYVRDSEFFSGYGAGKGNFGVGVEYSFDTIFGPISANVHWSDFTNKAGVYLSAGFNF
jgi:NTE family protein